MSWFSSRKFATPKILAPKPVALPESEAVRVAQAAREHGDWVNALIVLERVAKKKEASGEYQSLRQWALTCAGRRSKATPWSKLKLSDAVFDLAPNEAMALTHLVQEVRPCLILEVGSCGGGVARWLVGLCQGLGLNTEVHSADWSMDSKSHSDRVHFWSGDLRKPSGIWPGTLMKHLPHPTLVLLRTQAGYEVTWSALRSLHKWLGAGDILCVESEVDKTPDIDADPKRTAGHALARFAGRHPVEYEALPQFQKNFGPDTETATRLSCVRHTGLDPLAAEAAPGLDKVLALIAKDEWQAALDELNPRKATRTPLRGVDYLRALCFLGQGATLGACEAAKEELRYFPDHAHAQATLASLLRRLFPGKPKLGGAEFHELYRVVRPYTMVSDERLYSLYLRTRLVCQMDLPGDLVECGVAAGGGSAMIAATMARHTKRPRKLYSCDTFEGMPMPTDKDVAYGVDAESSGWGSGTCAAPTGSLLEVCATLGVSDRVVPVKGFFKDTLPDLKNELPDGIAFLHMDGDWYESTLDILESLYEKVQPRGFIQVDDYGHWEGCRQAMWDYAKTKGFEFKVHVIDGTGVWLQRPDRAETDLMMLNLGCGGHYHPDWINLDIAPSGSDVIQHDLAREPLPYEDTSCSAVYHSHVLEHIPPENVSDFINECFRVLAPNGVLRIAVPDLEGIAREYLRQLDAGDHKKHEWMIHELVDQLARHRSGGEMMKYWKQDPMPAEDFVFERVGWEVRQFVEPWRASGKVEAKAVKPDANAVGTFRLGGEVHQWMYDRLSLGRLLAEAGFEGIEVKSAVESGIAGFAGYELDADEAGWVRKPDSLFMEARKPSA